EKGYGRDLIVTFWIETHESRHQMPTGIRGDQAGKGANGAGRPTSRSALRPVRRSSMAARLVSCSPLRLGTQTAAGVTSATTRRTSGSPDFEAVSGTGGTPRDVENDRGANPRPGAIPARSVSPSTRLSSGWSRGPGSVNSSTVML